MRLIRRIRTTISTSDYNKTTTAIIIVLQLRVIKLNKHLPLLLFKNSYYLSIN